VDTVREALLVLDYELCVIAASRSFYINFRLSDGDVLRRPIFDIAGGQFNLPALSALLNGVMTSHAAVDGFEMEAMFPNAGKRTLILNTRDVHDEGAGVRTILLAFEDITERRIVELEKAALLEQTQELLRQKEVLLYEMQHRVANSLQIIASILLMKARLVTSEETRQHLEDAHRRVMSVATVQQHISAAGRSELVEIRRYLSNLCESLASSMIGDRNKILLNVTAGDSTVASADAVSLGLIVTELVINALKHAFPKDHPKAEIQVNYETSGTNWRLVVLDNGVGRPVDGNASPKRGLGTSLVAALAQQLEAQVETVNGPTGMKVSVTRATFHSQLPHAAWQSHRWRRHPPVLRNLTWSYW
jgi:two-component sensor histidine kinase